MCWFSILQCCVWPLLRGTMQTSLHEGCNVILRSDCASLIARLYREARSAVQAVYVTPKLELVAGGQQLQQLWARWVHRPVLNS
jgi:hypothetical protein